METNTFSKMCSKLFIRLIFLDVACFVLCAFGIAANSGNAIRILLQLCCIIVTISFVYPVCHKQGDLDAPFIATGHRKDSNVKGLLAGIIGCSPYLVSAIILVISRIFGVLPAFMNYYKMINSFFFPYLYSLMPTDYNVTEIPLSSFRQATFHKVGCCYFARLTKKVARSIFKLYIDGATEFTKVCFY